MSRSIIFLLFLSIYFLTSYASPSIAEGDFMKCLQSQNSVFDPHTIFTPKTPNYTTIWESMIGNWRPVHQYSSLSPNYIIIPLLESEIQKTILCSKKVGLLIKVISGGHDYEALSYMSHVPFVIVDLRNFRSINIDLDSKNAWVGAGSTLGELYHAISEKSNNLAFPAGTCPSVGVGGHFSGGGYGMMSRNFGISADNIVDARIIDVNGKILDRNAMGEDLFWAIRGGGAVSFGIVTTWKIKLVTVPEKVTVFNITKTYEENATELVHQWQSISSTIDRKLLMRLFILSDYSTTAPGNRTISVSFTSLYLGRVEDLLKIMEKSFPKLGLVKEDCSELTWIESILYFATIDPKKNSTILLPDKNRSYHAGFYKAKSDYVTQPISKDGLEKIWQKLHQENSGGVLVELSPYGGKMSEISESETPFPHRKGTLFMIHYITGGFHEEDSQRHLNWFENFYSYMETHVSKSPRRAYVNYRDLDLGTTNLVGRTSVIKARKWAGFEILQ